MRFPLAAVLFIVGSFIFFTFAGVSYYLMSTIDTAIDSLSPGYDATFQAIVDLLPTAFGVIAILFFVVGLLLIFVLESLSDEPEMYYRRY